MKESGFDIAIEEQVLPPDARGDRGFRIRTLLAIGLAALGGDRIPGSDAAYEPEPPDGHRRYRVTISDGDAGTLAQSAWTEDYLAVERLATRWAALAPTSTRTSCRRSR
jgi:hypothetical protein